MALKLCRLLTVSLNNFRSVPKRGIKHHVVPLSIEINKRQKKYFNEMSKEEYYEFTRRSNFLEWNYSCEIYAFGKRLKEEFPPELLVQAFTHRSYIEKEKEKHVELGVEHSVVDLKTNDVLASEGEEVITNYSSRYTSYFFPRFPLEGIEAIVTYLSSEDLLAYVSKNLGTTFLILSKDYPVENSTYAKTLKAIVGALKQCQGLQRSEHFVRDFIMTQLAGKDINDFLNITNPLEVLREILKRDGRDAPEPRIISQAGMKTIMANYHVGIYCNKQLIGHCSGESIDIAIETAAFDALKRLFQTTDSCRPMSYDLKDAPKKVNNVRLSEWTSTAFK